MKKKRFPVRKYARIRERWLDVMKRAAPAIRENKMARMSMRPLQEVYWLMEKATEIYGEIDKDVRDRWQDVLAEHAEDIKEGRVMAFPMGLIKDVKTLLDLLDEAAKAEEVAA